MTFPSCPTATKLACGPPPFTNFPHHEKENLCLSLSLRLVRGRIRPEKKALGNEHRRPKKKRAAITKSAISRLLPSLPRAALSHRPSSRDSSTARTSWHDEACVYRQQQKIALTVDGPKIAVRFGLPIADSIH